jgi:hypothetical protein
MSNVRHRTERHALDWSFVLNSLLRAKVMQRLAFFLNPEDLEWFNVQPWRPVSQEQAGLLLKAHESYYLSSSWPPSDNSNIEEVDRDHVAQVIQLNEHKQSVAILSPDDSFCMVLSPSNELSICGKGLAPSDA